MKGRMDRREFLKTGAKAGMAAAVAAAVAAAATGRWAGAFPAASAGTHPEIAAVQGADAWASTVKAVDLLGGMPAFVPKGSRVALLPNVQSRHPGTFTNPDILRAAIRMCRQAGAKEIHCLSGLTARHWADTGLDRIVEEEGASLTLVPQEEDQWQAVPVPKGKALTEVRLMKEFLSHDVFINMPITKDHAGNKFTGTMKNLMGLNARLANRIFHKENWKTDAGDIEFLDQCIADLNTVVRPTLCLVDATTIITTNGPMGPGELLSPHKVIAGTDRVAVDAYCSALWGLKPEEIFMIKKAAEHGLGEMNLKNVRITEIVLPS